MNNNRPVVVETRGHYIIINIVSDKKKRKPCAVCFDKAKTIMHGTGKLLERVYTNGLKNMVRIKNIFHEQLNFPCLEIVE